jgi:hypothetical protein
VTRCPVCEEIQLVFVAGPLVTWCYYCGARWIQEEGAQQDVEPANRPFPAFQSTELQGGVATMPSLGSL